MRTQISGNTSIVSDRNLIEHAIALLSQEVWCWGRDILRPKGNYLLEVGFQRFEPPASRKECSSVYSLKLPGERVVVLRGFGVFYGDPRLGGIFLPRYEFRPLYTKCSELNQLPWLHADLPELCFPTELEREKCAALTLDLIDWIRSYEVKIAETLGVEYRQSTLVQWDNGERPVIPAEDIPREWRLLGIAIAADLRAMLSDHYADKSQVS